MDTMLFSQEFLLTLVRFVICMAVNFLIVHVLYFRKSHRRDFYFTFLLMTVAIFFLVYFMMGMDRGKATMGVGLGLFGIFSIMRYRTDAMPVREMTYLFIIVCLSVVHAMAESMIELFIVDVISIVAIWLCELHLKVQPSKLIQYDRIEYTKQENRQLLLEDLEKRLGIKVVDVHVGAVDFLRDMVILRVSYEAEGQGSSDVDHLIKIKNTQYAEV